MTRDRRGSVAIGHNVKRCPEACVDGARDIAHASAIVVTLHTRRMPGSTNPAETAPESLREPQHSQGRVQSALPVVGVGEVDSCRGDVVELLPGAGLGLGDVDDVQDLGPPKRVICRARMPRG